MGSGVGSLHNTFENHGEPNDGNQFTVADVLAPPRINRGQKSAVHPNRFCLAGNTAILFCRATNGKVLGVRIDREDLIRVLKAGPWRVANFCKKSGRSLYAYASTRAQGKKRIVYLHRFILNAPPPSSGLEVDHRTRHTLDCRKSEIRLATKSLNQRNRGIFRPSAVGLRGVVKTRNGQRFIARVFIHKKAKQLGTFDTPEQAAQAVRDFNQQMGVIQ